jgi:hypothetical protein
VQCCAINCRTVRSPLAYELETVCAEACIPSSVGTTKILNRLALDPTMLASVPCSSLMSTSLGMPLSPFLPFSPDYIVNGAPVIVEPTDVP